MDVEMHENVECDYYKTDALVIGGGLSGLMAAKSIDLPMGKSLSILSAGTGSSAYIHGINIPLSGKDSIDCFINDTIESGCYQGDKILVEELCKNSLELISMSEEIGIDLDRKDDDYVLLQSLGSSWPRVVCSGNSTGIILMKKIRDELKKRDNLKIYNTLRALRIMVVENRVRGILSYDTKRKSFIFIEADAIVLASGGFCNIFPFSTNTSDISGDGIAMAYDCGALLTDLEFIQFEPCAAVYPDKMSGEILVTTMFYEGAVLRNIDGERFALKQTPSGEQVNKDVLSRMMSQEIMNGKGTPHGGIYFDATGMNVDKLKESYPTYVKRYIDCGIDITQEFAEVVPAPHTSLGGVVISPDCKTSIEGLFACGEVVGGIHGANRLGGNAGLETIVYGKRAGKSVSNYLLKQKHRTNCLLKEKYSQNWIDSILCPDKISSGNPLNYKQMKEIRKKMEGLLSSALNVTRCGPVLKEAVRDFEDLYNTVQNSITNTDSDEIFTKLRLRNDLLTAHLLAAAAYEREESLGCHNRSDSCSKDMNRYRIQVKQKAGKTVLEKFPLEL